ncbi:MAG: DNA methyltransferase [Thermodesulfobacteriota bacterium]
MAKPPLRLMTTTLWEYPSQHYGTDVQGDPEYAGATPSFIIWNLLMRYTRKKDLVVDPMAGSGTTLDVARDIGRRALGYDLAPSRKDIFRADARKLPLEDEKADFVFIDPPYSTHLTYSDSPDCIGKLPASGREYYVALDGVIREACRILRPDRHMALYVSDSYVKNKPFMAIGFSLFTLLSRYFVPVDVVAVVRHNAKLSRNHWHTSAVEGNYFLRGFNYLFIMGKPAYGKKRERFRPLSDRRDQEELEKSPTRRAPAKEAEGAAKPPRRPSPGRQAHRARQIEEE